MRRYEEEMRIGVIVPRLNRGGTGQCVADLAGGLARAGAEPTVVCLERSGELADRIRERGVEVIGPLKREGRNGLAPLRLAAILRQRRFDVVHCHNWGGLVDTVLAAKLAGVGAVVHTQHGLDYGFDSAPDHLRNRVRTAIKAVACRGVTRVATVSHDVARMVTREWGVPAARVSVVHNGVSLIRANDSQEVRASWRRELGVGEADVLFGTVSTFRPVKDLHTMLQAMSLIVRDTPRAKLVLIGDGPQRLELELAAARLGLRSAVLFPGWRSDATRLMPALDVFALSSVSEGISLALLEAMAAGVPAIATAVGGNCEIIRSADAGLLVPPRAPADLAQAMRSLVQDPSRRAALAAGGRRRVEDAFSLTRMVADYRQLYASLLN
jgi:sugar transferase (PEP-CTERM/EpsH1 system associated)